MQEAAAHAGNRGVQAPGFMKPPRPPAQPTSPRIWRRMRFLPASGQSAGSCGHIPTDARRSPHSLPPPQRAVPHLRRQTFRPSHRRFSTKGVFYEACHRIRSPRLRRLVPAAAGALPPGAGRAAGAAGGYCSTTAPGTPCRRSTTRRHGGRSMLNGLERTAPLCHPRQLRLQRWIRWCSNSPFWRTSALLALGRSKPSIATHGHRFHPDNPPPLCPGDILLCGHFHVPALRDCGSFTYVNPGSVSLPKEESPHSCIVMEDGALQWVDISPPASPSPPAR